jgi:ProP effector
MRTQELHPLTEKINKKQKANAKKLRDEALKWLASTFPAAFDDTLSIHPLKTGIMVDILAFADKALILGISKTKLREAVILFTRRIDYLACLKAQEMRIDLYGNPTVPVSHDEASQAADKIKIQIEKIAKSTRQKSIPPAAAIHPMSKNSPSPMQPRASSAYTSDIDLYQETPMPRSAATVVITRKAPKAFDPDAVARLKEKLGLSIASSAQ